MGKYIYSTDINAKIDKVCKDCAVQLMLDFPEQSVDEIDEFLKLVVHFLKDNFTNIGAQEYILVLDFDKTQTGPIVSSQIVLDEIKNDNNLIKVNGTLQVLESGRIENLSNLEVSRYSKKNDCILIQIHNGLDISIYSKGMLTDQKNVRNPLAKPPVNNRFNRTADDYKISLIDFYKEKVRTNLTKHWFKESQRILRGGQTEEIFQIALVQWFSEHLSMVKVYAKPKKLSADETDIEIVKHGGNNYLLELKWLGKNENSDYPLSKITGAMHQVENYLESDQVVLEATLVVYDGRGIEEFNKFISIEEETGNWKQIKECETMELSSRATAYVFHLINQPASKRKSA